MLSEKFIRSAIKRRLNEKVGWGASTLTTSGDTSSSTSSGKSSGDSESAAVKPKKEKQDGSIKGPEKVKDPKSKSDSGLFKKGTNEEQQFIELAKKLNSYQEGYPIADIHALVIDSYISIAKSESNINKTKIIFGDEKNIEKLIRGYIKDGDINNFFGSGTEPFKEEMANFLEVYKEFSKYRVLSYILEKEFNLTDSIRISEKGLDEISKDIQFDGDYPKLLNSEPALKYDYENMYNYCESLYISVYDEFISKFEKYWTIWSGFRKAVGGYTDSNKTVAMTYILYDMVKNDHDDLRLSRMFSAYCQSQMQGFGIGSFDGQSSKFKSIILYGLNNDANIQSILMKLGNNEFLTNLRNEVYVKLVKLDQDDVDSGKADLLNIAAQLNYTSKVFNEEYQTGGMTAVWGNLFGGQDKLVKRQAEFQSEIIGKIVRFEDKNSVLSFFKKNEKLVAAGKKIIDTNFKNDLSKYDIGGIAKTEESEKTEKPVNETRELIELARNLITEKKSKGVTLNAKFYDDKDQAGWLFFYAYKYPPPGKPFQFDKTIFDSFEGPTTGTFRSEHKIYDVLYCFENTDAGINKQVNNNSDKSYVDLIFKMKGFAESHDGKFDLNRLFAFKRSKAREIGINLRNGKTPDGFASITAGDFKPLGHAATGGVINIAERADFEKAFLEHDDLFEALSLGVVFQGISNERDKNNGDATVIFNLIKNQSDTVKIGRDGITYQQALETSDDKKDTPEDKERSAKNKRIIDSVYDEIIRSADNLDTRSQQELDAEREKAKQVGAMDLSKDGLANKHPLFKRAWTLFSARKISKKSMSGNNFRLFTTDIKLASRKFAGGEGENEHDRLAGIMDRLSRLPDVPQRLRYGRDETRTVGAGDVIRATEDFEKIFNNIKFNNSDHRFEAGYIKAKMGPEGEKFLDVIATLLNNSKFLKKRSGQPPKEIIIKYDYDNTGKLIRHTLNYSPIELQKLVGRRNLQTINSALIDSYKTFQETGVGGVLSTLEDIYNKAGGALTADSFTLTLPVAKYVSVKQRQEQLGENKIVTELKKIIRKLK